MSGGGTQNLIFSARTLQCKFQSLVIGQKRMSAGFEGRELVLEILHVPFFTLAERALSVARLALKSEETTADSTYAALFCAFRLL
jgi:hypothetical protein